MIDPARLRETMARRGLSQAELARRIGVSQATINKLAVGQSYGSKHLHRIARHLETTPAFLEGETDDPDKDAPPPAPKSTIQIIRMDVVLPSTLALAQMFEGMLDIADRSASADALALELAEMLPSALSALRGQLLEKRAPAQEPTRASEPAQALATADHESSR